MNEQEEGGQNNALEMEDNEIMLEADLALLKIKYGQDFLAEQRPEQGKVLYRKLTKGRGKWITHGSSAKPQKALGIKSSTLKPIRIKQFKLQITQLLATRWWISANYKIVGVRERHNYLNWILA